MENTNFLREVVEGDNKFEVMRERVAVKLGIDEVDASKLIREFMNKNYDDWGNWIGK